MGARKKLPSELRLEADWIEAEGVAKAALALVKARDTGVRKTIGELMRRLEAIVESQRVPGPPGPPNPPPERGTRIA